MSLHEANTVVRTQRKSVTFLSTILEETDNLRGIFDVDPEPKLWSTADDDFLFVLCRG